MNFSYALRQNGTLGSVSFAVDLGCLSGFEPTNKASIGPGGWHESPRMLRARRTGPAIVQMPTSPAIYKFEICEPTQQLPHIYIGKTRNLNSRFRDYLEMTRGLVALHAGHGVSVGKDPFRYIHYKIARALVEGLDVVFSYCLVDPKVSDQNLARIELLEIASVALEYHSKELFDFAMMNEMDKFCRSQHEEFDFKWAKVQAILITAEETRLKEHKAVHASGAIAGIPIEGPRA